MFLLSSNLARVNGMIPQGETFFASNLFLCSASYFLSDLLASQCMRMKHLKFLSNLIILHAPPSIYSRPSNILSALSTYSFLPLKLLHTCCANNFFLFNRFYGIFKAKSIQNENMACCTYLFNQKILVDLVISL